MEGYPSWPKGADCKSVGDAFEGSNPSPSTILIKTAGWSSLVARRAHNPKVVGSNPAPATIFLQVAVREILVVFLSQKNQTRNGLEQNVWSIGCNPHTME